VNAPRSCIALFAAALIVSHHAYGAVIYQTVARTGQQAPGTAVNTVYANNFSTPSINNVGQVIFSTQVSGGGATFNTSNVLYAGAPGSLSLVARAGNPAPGLPAGTTYSLFHS
jgi:hypothetical protein